MNGRGLLEASDFVQQGYIVELNQRTGSESIPREGVLGVVKRLQGASGVSNQRVRVRKYERVTGREGHSRLGHIGSKSVPQEHVSESVKRLKKGSTAAKSSTHSRRCGELSGRRGVDPVRRAKGSRFSGISGQVDRSRVLQFFEDLLT